MWSGWASYMCLARLTCGSHSMSDLSSGRGWRPGPAAARHGVLAVLAACEGLMKDGRLQDHRSGKRVRYADSHKGKGLRCRLLYLRQAGLFLRCLWLMPSSFVLHSPRLFVIGVR